MLVILPNQLDPSQDPDSCFPLAVKKTVGSLTALIAESEKGARRFLSLFMNREVFNQIKIRLLNEHSSKEEIEQLACFVQEEKVCGLISDAGIPCLADPGSRLVFALRKKNVPITTHVGLCSIVQALVLSGFNAQQFCFHGYLPREMDLLEKKLLELEAHSHRATQIWIDTPYRSEKMYGVLIKTLRPKTYLSIAKSLSLRSELVKTQTIASWRSEKGFFTGKEPAVFLLSSEKGLS